MSGTGAEDMGDEFSETGDGDMLTRQYQQMADALKSMQSVQADTIKALGRLADELAVIAGNSRSSLKADDSKDRLQRTMTPRTTRTRSPRPRARPRLDMQLCIRTSARYSTASLGSSRASRTSVLAVLCHRRLAASSAKPADSPQHLPRPRPSGRPVRSSLKSNASSRVRQQWRRDVHRHRLSTSLQRCVQI